MKLSFALVVAAATSGFALENSTIKQNEEFNNCVNDRMNSEFKKLYKEYRDGEECLFKFKRGLQENLVRSVVITDGEERKAFFARRFDEKSLMDCLYEDDFAKTEYAILSALYYVRPEGCNHN